MSEIKHHMPILINFIKKMNNKDYSYSFIFHSTLKIKNLFPILLKKEKIENIEIIFDDKIKNACFKEIYFCNCKIWNSFSRSL